VANAVKEIITALRKHNQQNSDIRINVVKIKPAYDTISLKPGILIGSLVILTLIVLTYFFFLTDRIPQTRLKSQLQYCLLRMIVLRKKTLTSPIA